MNKLNEHSKILLENYLNNLDGDGQKPSFFILSGPKDIGKSQMVVDLAKKLLGDFFYSDFLHIKDFSRDLGKEHELKVEYKDDNSVSKDLFQLYNYEDLGVREINNWLEKSFAGSRKIVLIENIERMNGSAMNAFLKTCEEPLANRVILATTSNKSRILDTIISRSIIVPFFEYSYEDLLNRCDEMGYFLGDNELKSFVCLMCMGKQGTLDFLHGKFTEDDELKKVFTDVVNILKNGTIGLKYKTLLYICNAGLVEPFVDGLIGYYVLNDEMDLAQKWLNIRKDFGKNVKIDHLMFYGLI